MAGIPFVRDLQFSYGEAKQVSPLVQRIVADNPGPFTYTGTGVYVIGGDEVAVIDPGPNQAPHFEALKRALDGRTVKYVLVTHSHMDHSPLAHPLATWAGCEVYAGGPVIPTESEVRLEAGDDLNFKPDHKLVDGQVLAGDGWTIEAIATPGHTSNHFCYALREENALFAGDHVMGWSTTVISPPDGHMGDYYASLEKIRARNFDVIWPTHGPEVRDVAPFLDAYMAHRRDREAAILARLGAGDTKIPDMVREIYRDVDKRLHPAACHSVLAHVIHLVESGRVKASSQDEPCTVQTDYVLA